MSKTQLTEEQK